MNMTLQYFQSIQHKSTCKYCCENSENCCSCGDSLLWSPIKWIIYIQFKFKQSVNSDEEHDGNTHRQSKP